MRGVLLAAGAVVLLGFAGCGGDEFSEPTPAGTGGQGGQAGSSGAAGQAGQAGSSGASGAAGKAGAAGQGGGGPTPEDACQQYAAAYCDRYETCAPALVDIFYGDVDMCVKRLMPVCVEAVGLAGTTKSPAFTAKCASALKAFSCDYLLARYIPAECKPAPGARAEGEPCGEEGQCATGYCKYEGGEGCGVCRNRASSGGICAVETDCDPGLTCSPDKKCAPFGELSAECDANKPCRLGLSCVGSTNTATGTCQKASAGGEGCDGKALTKPNCDTLQGLYCNLSGICQKALLAKDGEACGVITGKGYALCTASAKCDPSVLAGTCTPAASDGETCDNEAGPYCMPLSQCIEGKCTPPVLSSCK